LPFGETLTAEFDLTVPPKPDSMPIRPLVPWILLLSCPLVWVLDRFARKAPEAEAEAVGKGKKARRK
jgi:hypothetical protein